MKYKYDKELIESLIIKSENIAEVIEFLGLKYNGGIYKYLKNFIKEHNVDISHFSHRKTKSDLINIFIKDSQVVRNTIKRRVIKENLIPYKCSICNQDEHWQGKIMPMILDHINGIHNDNRLENLRFLCSNCDSIQDTYKSKNTNVNKKLIKNRENILFHLKKLELQKNKEVNKLFSINKIKTSDINFEEKGWGNKLSKIMNWSPQYSRKFVNVNIPELWNISYKHKN